MPGKSKVISLAKLTPPQLPRILERTRLFEELDHWREQHRVIWIQGPPGAGKTTLVASYLQARKLKPLWYQVDEGDADPGAWFHYLSLGMKQVASRYKKPLPSLSPEYLPGISVFTRRFFEELYGRLRAPGVVVLDNYQEVGNAEPVHDLVNVALTAIPEGTTVIMISRAHPPATFARLQAEQQLAIVAPGRLQLTLQETKELLHLRGGASLQNAKLGQAEILYHRTQGWVAGVVLLVAQQGGERPAAITPETQAVAPVVFDYFASQVFTQQSEERQNFLLQTAFFTSMTVTMAEQITGVPEAKQYLSDLARSQYFTVRHASEEPLYQYHPLFRQFLQRRIQEIWKPKVVRTLQGQTADVLEQAGRYEEALVLYLEIKNLEDVVRLILQYAPMLFAQGRYQTIEIWLAELRSDVISSNLWLRYWQANCKFLKNPKESMQLFEPLVKEFEQDRDLSGTLLSWCGVIDSIMFSFDKFSLLDVWIDYLLNWLKKEVLFPSPELEARVTFSMFSSLIWRRLGESQTIEWEFRVQALIQHVPDMSQRVIVGCHLYGFWSWLGNIEKGKMILTKTEEWTTSDAVSPLARIMFLNYKAVHEWSSGEGLSAMTAFTLARKLVQKHGLNNLVMTLFSQGVAAAVLLKDNSYAMSLLHEIRPMSERNQGMHGSLYRFLLAWVTAVEGNYNTAHIHGVSAVELHETALNEFLQVLVRWTQVQILIELGELRDADEQLVRIRALQRTLNSRTVDYMVAFLEAQLAMAQNQHNDVLTAIEKTMLLSRETGMVFAMGCLPQVLTRICSAALEHGVEVEQARHVIKKIKLVPQEPRMTSDSWPWPVRVYTLGCFVLMGEAGAISFARKVPKAPLALLKLLIALGGKNVSQSQVMEWLWPDADGDAAYRSLKMTLSRLRKLLTREDAILFSGGALSINPEVCWVDCLSFRELVKQSEIEAQQGNSAKSGTFAERASELYKGEFLPHNDDSWVLPIREGLQKSYLSLINRMPIPTAF